MKFVDYRYPLPDEGPAQVEVCAEGAAEFKLDDGPPLVSTFTAWLAAEVAKIPEEHRPTAELRFHAFEHQVESARVEYLRPETDDELAARKARDRDYAARQERLEREQLARLQAKYERTPEAGQ